jgi:hypothetical protein
MKVALDENRRIEYMACYESSQIALHGPIPKCQARAGSW